LTLAKVFAEGKFFSEKAGAGSENPDQGRNCPLTAKIEEEE